MLVVVQFPICDSRVFFPGQTARLQLPEWPTPRFEVNPQFVRHFGPAALRRLGANPAWFGETIYCSARRALRFDALPSAGGRNDELYGSPVCAFRRFFSDGRNAARVEVGVHLRRGWRSSLRSTARAVGQVQSVLDLPTHVQGMAGPAALMAQGSPLARLYCRASSHRSTSAPVLPELVQDGSPVCVVELGRYEDVEPPDDAVIVDESQVGGISAWFTWIRTGVGAVGTWFIGPQPPISTTNLRTLRLALLRLHSEQEALDLVLKHIQRGDLPYAPRTPAGDQLEDYLNQMIHLLRRDSRFSVAQRELIAALAASGAGAAKDPDELLDRLKGARRQILRQVENYERERQAQRPVTVYSVEEGGVLKVEQQNISGGTFYGPVINSIVAGKIDRSFDTVVNSSAPDDLKRALGSLHDEARMTVAAMTDSQQGEANRLTDALTTFSEHAVKDRPLQEVVRAAGREILEAAKIVAARAEPILGAVNTVLGILGIAGLA